MRHAHFDTFRPVCPVCRAAGADHPLRIDRVARADADHVLDAVLGCPNCGAVYPVLDGIPVIAANAREVVAGGAHALLARDDLSAVADDLIADCCGPGSAADTTRQQASSYAWDHYAEFDPAEPPGDPRPGAAARLLARGLELAGPADGHALDLGCSVGRTTFELAAATGGLSLGLDLNLAKLRVAVGVLRTGRVRYPRRRVGAVYDRREFAVPFDRGRVDFWACDVSALPLPARAFSTVASLNVYDSTADPTGHLRAAAAAVAGGGWLVTACPYDWSAAAAVPDRWAGGADPGRAAADLLTAAGLAVVAEAEVPWQVRLHDRAAVASRCHLLAARRPR